MTLLLVLSRIFLAKNDSRVGLESDFLAKNDSHIGLESDFSANNFGYWSRIGLTKIPNADLWLRLMGSCASQQPPSLRHGTGIDGAREPFRQGGLLAA